MNYQAILFDLDGTLVNSIDLYREAVIASMEDVGVTVTQEEFRAWYIQGLHLRHLLKQYGKTEDTCPGVRADRDRRYTELLREKVVWYPGVQEMLRPLGERCPLALVTGSWMKFVDAIDERLHLKSFFRTVVTADDVGKFAKPHPHGLLLACDRLTVNQRECLYVGDQLFDVEACERAGMQSCIVQNEYTPQAAVERADFVVKSLEELRNIVKD